MFEYNGTNATQIEAEGLPETGGWFTIYVTKTRRPRFLWAYGDFEEHGQPTTLAAAVEGAWEAYFAHQLCDLLGFCEGTLLGQDGDFPDAPDFFGEEEFESLTGEEADKRFFDSCSPLYVRTEILKTEWTPGIAAGFNIFWRARVSLPSGPMTANLCWTIDTRKAGPRKVEAEITCVHTLGPESDCRDSWDLTELLAHVSEVRRTLVTYAEECGFSVGESRKD